MIEGAAPGSVVSSECLVESSFSRSSFGDPLRMAAKISEVEANLAGAKRDSGRREVKKSLETWQARGSRFH